MLHISSERCSDNEWCSFQRTRRLYPNLWPEFFFDFFYNFGFFFFRDFFERCGKSVLFISYTAFVFDHRKNEMTKRCGRDFEESSFPPVAMTWRASPMRCTDVILRISPRGESPVIHSRKKSPLMRRIVSLSSECHRAVLPSFIFDAVEVSSLNRSH